MILANTHLQQTPIVFIIEQETLCPLAAKDHSRLPFDNLTQETLQALAPATVVCALFGKTQDATVVLARLAELGCKARCVVIGPKLPRKDLVLKELKSYASGLEIELLEAEPEP